MTTRERTLAYLLFPPLVLVGGGFFAYQLWYEPLVSRDERITALTEEIRKGNVAKQQIEAKKGQYDFSAYDRLLATCDQHHIRAILILDYSNKFYDNDLSPNSEEGRAAFAKWAAESVKHFKGRSVLWEMYNEPNIQFWRPAPKVEDYIKLAIATGKAIKAAAPDELYIGPA